MTDNWITPATLEDLNGWITAGRVAKLECRYRDVSGVIHAWKFCIMLTSLRSENDWRDLEYRITLNAPKTDDDDGWVYPPSREALNTALESGEVTELQFGAVGDWWTTTNLTPRVNGNLFDYRFKRKTPAPVMEPWATPKTLYELNTWIRQGRIITLQAQPHDFNDSWFTASFTRERSFKDFINYKHRARLAPAKSAMRVIDSAGFVRPQSREEMLSDWDAGLIIDGAYQHKTKRDSSWRKTNLWRPSADNFTRWNYRYKLKETEMTTLSHESKTAYGHLQSQSGIEVGDTVRVIEIGNVLPEALGFSGWGHAQQKRIGNGYEVTAITHDGVWLKTQRDGYVVFPFFALRVTRKAPKKMRIADHDITINRDGTIKFGCTTISRADVERVLKVWYAENAVS